MEKTLRKNIIVLALIIAACIASFIGLVYFSAMMNQKQISVIDAKERLASYEQNKRAFAEESVKLQQIGTRIANLESSTITLETVPQFLSSLERLGSDRGIDFTITTVQTPQGPDDTSGFLVSFSIKGSKDRIIDFSNALLSQAYQVQFTKFSLYADSSNTTSSAPAVLGTSKTKNAPAPSVEWNLLATIKVISF